jgi:hypothetical protein
VIYAHEKSPADCHEAHKHSTQHYVHVSYTELNPNRTENVESMDRRSLAVAYATGRASHARQVKDDDPDKKGYPGPPGWGFGVGLATPHS